MTVQIINKAMAPERCLEIRDKYRDALIPSEQRPGYFEANAREWPEVLTATALARIEIEKHYDVIINEFDVTLVRLEEGAFNGLHSDMYTLDGSYDPNDEGKDLRQYSALIYLSEYGTDFTGGELVFPQHDIKFAPHIGDLVFFIGDLEHTHKVRHILSGERYAIVMFFGT